MIETRETLGTFKTLFAANEALEQNAVALRNTCADASFTLEIRGHSIGPGPGEIVQRVEYVRDSEGNWKEKTQ